MILPEDLDQVSYITSRGRRMRDAATVTLFMALAVSLAFQIKANNAQISRDQLVTRRQHDSCVSRRELARESRVRQFVLTRFLDTAASTRMKLSLRDADPRSKAINYHTARYWKYRLLPMIHTVPIPAAC